MNIVNIIFFFAALGIISVFILNPCLIILLYIFRRKKRVKHTPARLSVSLIIVVRNGESLVEEKIQNIMSLRFPSENKEIIFYSDGSTDNTEEAIKPFLKDEIRLISSNKHEGKHVGINAATRESKGEILVFSDMDALLNPEAVIRLVQHFSDPEIGGVCGQRRIREKNKSLAVAQSRYISLDSIFKTMESWKGSITSNDGKLYAIRRSLFNLIPPAVTDDLFALLNIIQQNKRFVFEPGALAYIMLPSRSVKHELARRRRIVSRSLRGILLMRSLLNPVKYGFFSIHLFINKILRRCIPIFLIIILPCSLFLCSNGLLYTIILILQAAFYLSCVIYHVFYRTPKERTWDKLHTRIKRHTLINYYFFIANKGMLLGLADFLKGKKISRWTPVKNDSKENQI